MGNKESVTQHKSAMENFDLKPLSACVRMAIVSGVVMSSMSSAYADLPVSAEVMAATATAVAAATAVTVEKPTLPIPVSNGQDFATLGTATLPDGYNKDTAAALDKLDINQTTDRAILKWDSFNVGADKAVYFHQPSSSSIALNRVVGNDTDPSSILGKVTADGQIYLYNQNGFLFGKDSQVNVNTLVASTLNISDKVFQNGIVREFDDTGNAALAADSGAKTNGIINVEAGARLHVDKNGRLLMAASEVNNNGNISAEDQGQILLVASKDKVYLQPADKNSPFAGLLVEVGSGGKVTNQSLGNISAKQGNITLAGFAVNQEGRVTATTSVSVNGSIRLLAREGAEKQNEALVATQTTRQTAAAGESKESKVTFKNGSTTEILADNSGGLAIDEQKQPTSYMEVSAYNVEMENGSKIHAPSGTLSVTATDNLLDPVQSTKGQILVGQGASIDVSGTKHIAASVERNVVAVPVQSYELRDSPLQKGGVLKGQTVQVDIRKQTKIIDTSGALARFERGIDERLGTGGTVNFVSSGDVVVNDGATIDISGGSIDYQSGYINTTKLLTDYGRIVDISEADPNEHYAEIYGIVKQTTDKWGTKETVNEQAEYSNSRFEEGYTQGLDAGSVNLSTPKMTWNGDLAAGAEANINQRTADSIAFGGAFNFDSTEFNTAQNIVLQGQKNTQDTADLVLSTALTNASGIQQFNIKTLGGVTVAADANVEMQPNSQFSLDVGKIDIEGNIYSAGGTLNLTSRNTGLVDNSGKLDVGSNAVVDVSGRWVNDFAQGYGATPSEPLAINAGSIKMSAVGDLTLNTGSALKADGGAWLAMTQQVTNGKAGSLSLATSPRSDNKSSLLSLGGSLSAFGLDNGGSLALATDQIIVGQADKSTLLPSDLVLDVHDGRFDIAKNAGFSSYKLTATAKDVIFRSDADLALTQQNRILDGDFNQQASSASIAGFSRLETLPEPLRNPVDLNLVALRDIKLETGSEILGDKQAAISLSTTVGGIYVDGKVDAPAGAISLRTNADPGVEYNNAQAIWLGSHADITAMGAPLLNPLGGDSLRTGVMLDGGKVTIKAQRGFVVTEAGSQIDVSGSRTVLDLPVANKESGGIHYEPTIVASNGGTIAITAAEGGVLDGQFKGIQGGATRLGGQMTIALDRLERNPPDPALIPFPNADLSLNIVQTAQTQLPNNLTFGTAMPNSITGQMLVSADKLNQGGFADDRFVSNNQVKFSGDVNLSTQSRIDIDAPRIAWESLEGASNGAVTLNTAFLRIGSNLIREVDRLPSLGQGQFTANTQWSELGGASLWTGFSDVHLNSAHDLRTLGIVDISQANRDYVGEMVTAANLTLSASQVYPATLAHFSFSLKNNPDAQLNIASSGNQDKTPLSAAGILSFDAPVINQNGVVLAPLGNINLNAANTLSLGENSVTSVSAAGQLIPFGVIQGGLDWLYPLDSNHNLVLATPPEKKLVLSAPTVNLAKGSTVDLAGGGDLLAYEFLPGSGGSFDYLDKNSLSYQGGFAVVPSLGSAIAPYDPMQSAGFNYAPGSQVYLSGTPDLPAGEYTILPPRYALLPGAFLVTPQANSTDSIAATTTAAGLPVVPGYQALAGTTVKEPRWNSYLIESGTDIRKHSEYDEQKANTFYANQAQKNGLAAPILPMDSGQISIAAQDKLELQGDFKVASFGGRGAKMDIAANRLKIVKTLSDTPTQGTLEVLADDLSQLGVDSLFLGGSRSNNVLTAATDLNVTSDEVTFDTNAKVAVTDLAVAAKNKVEIMSGAELSATGTVNTGDSLFNITGDGAFIRVSADNQVTLNRTSIQGQSGDLLIQDGAILAASKSMLLDASQSTTLAGDIQMNGGSLNLSANAINIGEVSGLSNNDLNLTNEKLHNLAVDTLVLSSKDSVDFYGNVGFVNAAGSLEPLKFDNLSINAAGFSGFGKDGEVAKLSANTLNLQNSINAQSTHAITGQGSLELSATNYTQGQGKFDVFGFKQANIAVDQGFKATGAGSLNFQGDVNLTAGYMTGAGGSHLDMDASGYRIQTSGNSNVTTVPAVNLGGAMNLTADAIDFNANVLMPSGSIGLHSLQGNVVIGKSANLNLAGRAVNFADMVSYTPGGDLRVTADKGQISLLEGSVVDLSSSGDTAKGGTLSLKALEKTIDLAGKIKATAGGAELDLAQFSATAGFDSLMNTLNAAGITKSLSFRIREGDIVQASNQIIKANDITLVADQGAINLAGQLNANASATGGSISLYAGDKLSLEQGSQLSATGAIGGNVLISSVDNDADDNSGITIKSGSLIDVSGASKEAGGSVTLRALRVDRNQDGVDDAVNIQPIAGTVQGYAEKATGTRFYAEAVKKYSNSDFAVLGQIGATDIAKIQQDNNKFMTADTSKTVAAELGEGIRLKPGVEIDYNGDLALNSRWDLVDWRYADNAMPGTLTINTNGNLALNASLTDGFKDETLVGVNIRDRLQTGDSWTYRLTAGADLNSAELGATSTSKNLTLAANTVIRTGTGDIQLAAGGNVKLTDQTSTIYNAGRAETSNRYGTMNDAMVAFMLYGEYPVDGGDLVIKAGNNIEGAISNQFIDSWLLRLGSWTNNPSHTNELPTAWAVATGYTSDGYGNAADSTVPLFQENMGSFGGGKVNISAAGNINNLSVMIPTTGKQVGQAVEGSFSDFTTNAVQVQGGGDMQIAAGANITGGAYFLAQGNGSISAGGEITGNSLQFAKGPQLVLGDSQFELSAKSGIKIAGASDAMVLHSGNNYALDGSNFFSYTDKSGLNLQSLSGDIHLGADTSLIGSTNMLNISGSQASLSKIYPASLKSTAYEGSVLVDNQITLYPSPTANLTLLAKNNIASNVDSLRLSMSDADKLLLPSSIYPLARNQLNDSEAVLNPFGISALVHAAVPVHSNDNEPVRIVTTEGDIKSIQINVPKNAIIQSGNDINNVLLNVQHLNDGDVSIISAGRDIRFTSTRSPDGLLVDNFNAIKVAGPGDVLVKAGRDIDFGASGGLSTVGNLTNTNLSSDVGANIGVLAGLQAKSADYTAFVDIVKYAGKYGDYKTLIGDFMRVKLGDSALIGGLLSTVDLSADDYAIILGTGGLNAEVYAAAQQKLDALGGNQAAKLPLTADGSLDVKAQQLRYQELVGSAALQEFKQLNPSDYSAIQPQMDALLSSTYANQYAAIKDIVVPFIQKMPGNKDLSETDALAVFAKLQPDQYLPLQPQLNSLVNQVFFNELKASGTASAESASAGNVRGFRTIETLFPGADWSGNLSLFFSKLQTLQGGDINLMVPGGEINAGLAVSFSGAKQASELGIVAQSTGNINAFVRNDFIVNQSRVFALNTGNILIWSSEGDIDAGRGAKSAIAAPPPEYSFDDKGNLVVTFPPVVSGSGIRTAAPTGSRAGDVFLFAPKGIVNAGEAGIGGTNVTISATAVLGANNIQVGGVSSGVPVASTGGLSAGLAGVGNLNASVSQVAQASADMSKDSKETNNKSMKLGVLSVEVIGYGESNANDDAKKNKLK